MIILDASGLYSAIDASQPEHVAARAALEAESPPYVLSPFVLAEVDYLIRRDVGVEAELALLADVCSRSYTLALVDRVDVEVARTVVEQYRDLDIGIADASVVVLAKRFGTDRLLTLDERDFRAIRTLDGRPFTLLPADA